MVTLVAVAVFAASYLPSKSFEAIQPKWVTTHWLAKDPFAGAWKPYADALRENPGFVENSGWAERAERAIAGLGKNPDAMSLYKAAACYLTAHDLDWRFELDTAFPDNPAQRSCWSALWTQLFLAWVRFNSDPGSREFCRVGMAVCSPSPGPTFEADGMPQALLKEFPNDRLVISSLVWYTRTPDKPRTQAWMDWVLAQAKRLPSLPGARPQDYLTVASAFAAHRFSLKEPLRDLIGFRDNVLQFQKRVPPEFAKMMDKELRGAIKQIKKLGG